MADLNNLIQAISNYTGDLDTLEHFTKTALAELGENWGETIFTQLPNLDAPTQEKLNHAYNYYYASLAWHEANDYLSGALPIDITTFNDRIEQLHPWVNFFGDAGDTIIAQLHEKAASIQPTPQPEPTPETPAVIEPETTPETIPAIEAETTPDLIAEDPVYHDEKTHIDDVDMQDFIEIDGDTILSPDAYIKIAPEEPTPAPTADTPIDEEDEDTDFSPEDFTDDEISPEDYVDDEISAEDFIDKEPTDFIDEEATDFIDEESTDFIEEMPATPELQDESPIMDESPVLTEAPAAIETPAMPEVPAENPAPVMPAQSPEFIPAELPEHMQNHVDELLAPAPADIMPAESDIAPAPAPVFTPEQPDSPEQFMIKKTFRALDFANTLKSWINARCIQEGNIEIYAYKHYGFLIETLQLVHDDIESLLADPILYPAIEQVQENGLKTLQNSLVAIKKDLSIAHDNMPSDSTNLIGDDINTDDIKKSLGMLDTSNQKEYLGPAPDGFEVMDDPYQDNN